LFSLKRFDEAETVFAAGLSLEPSNEDFQKGIEEAKFFAQHHKFIGTNCTLNIHTLQINQPFCLNAIRGI
jgi:hypothetical protein